MTTDDERMTAAIAEFYGTCPVCGRRYALNRNGAIRKHWKRDGSGKGLPFSDPCAGSQQQPTTPSA